MNIYLITRKDTVTYEENISVVVAAETRKEAGTFANNDCSCEGRIWLDKTKVSFLTLTKNACQSVKAGILCTSNRGA